MAIKKNVDLMDEALMRRVTVRLFKDNGKYKDDVHVEINGKMWVIQRGVDVEMPYYVWLVLEQSMKQDSDTAALIEKLSTKDM